MKYHTGYVWHDISLSHPSRVRDAQAVKPPEGSRADVKAMIEQLQKSPELASALAQIIR